MFHGQVRPLMHRFRSPPGVHRSGDLPIQIFLKPMNTPCLAQITLYPIKSLDGISVDQAPLLASGALKGDREFAIVDYQGKFVHGKRTPVIHQLRAGFDLAQRTVTLNRQGDAQATTFHLDQQRIPLENWLSNFFGFPVKLIQNSEMGFPDDTHSPGPTLISTETIAAVTSWFPELTVPELRSRLRTTLEITNTEAFWEDRLYAQAGNLVPFQIGTAHFLGVNPCQRCIVPTRSAKTGEPYANFQKIFVTQRQATLPDWVEATRFNHYYRLAVNTRCPACEAGKVLQVGDPILN
jgi:uncharacterized protein